jgi:hypothetical protein
MILSECIQNTVTYTQETVHLVLDILKAVLGNKGITGKVFGVYRTCSMF